MQECTGHVSNTLVFAGGQVKGSPYRMAMVHVPIYCQV